MTGGLRMRTELGQGLYQEQTQKLIMTLQMKQAIEVLQSTTDELQAYLAKELDGNPCVDVEMPTAFRGIRSLVRGSLSVHSRSSSTSSSAIAPPIEQTVAYQKSMQENLMSQLRVQSQDPLILKVTSYLTGLLDERGYLTMTEKELVHTLNLPQQLIEAAIFALQNCDPLGIGARNLQECLRLQLPLITENLRTLVQQLIDHYLTDIAAGRHSRIMKALQIEPQQFQQALDALRKLNPNPGFSYLTQLPQYVVPDVLVEQVNEDFVVSMNEAALPKIHLNPNYEPYLTHQNTSVKQFIAKNMQTAEWVARCVEQRCETLHRVAQAIVLAQYGFFQKGLTAMRPLTMRMVAGQLGIHESTVSRAVRGKYMQTPRGVFELKFFFSAELKEGSGSSAEAAKYQIRQCIDEESPEHPFSDDEMVQILQERGIQLSRRTVAKYREEMKIPNSSQRRRFR